MKRILAVLVIGLLALTGCTDTANWTKIEVSYTDAAAQGDGYRLVVEPTSATLTQGTNVIKRDIDKSVWETVRNSMSAMGPRTASMGCGEGQRIEVKGFTATGEAYRFESNSCEADSKVAEVKRIFDAIVQLFR